MEVSNASETNDATTSSFLQRLRVVSGFFKLRDAATCLAGGLWRGAFGFGIQEKEDDLEAGAPEDETNVQTRAVRNPIFQKALLIMPTFPVTFCFTLPGLLCLAQIKWQLAPLGFPSSTLHNWYIICVTSLLSEFVASVAQWIISAAGGP